MSLDVRFITFARNGLDDRGGTHVGFPELRPGEGIHITEARPLRRCVARPSKECQPHDAPQTQRWMAALCSIRVDRPLVCPTPAVSGRTERVRAGDPLDVV